MVATVFSADGCPHCARAKGLLDAHDIPFEELSLSDYPELRKTMVALAQSLTVPQVFFNGELVAGGASAVAQLAEAGELKAEYDAAMERSPDAQVAEQLRKPEGEPAPRAEPSPRRDDSFAAPGSPETSMSAVDVSLKIAAELPKAFSGAQLSHWVRGAFGLSAADSGPATELAQRIATEGLVAELGGANSESSRPAGEVYVAKGAGRFEASSFWRVEHRRPTALNLFRRWADRTDAPNVVAVALKKKLTRVLDAHRDDKGLVHYYSAAHDPAFAAFEEAACELQDIELGEMDARTRLAFVINVYNLLTLHAFTRLGVPGSDLQRVEFFDNVGYQIGGQFWAFNDLENGVLRTNKPPPYHLGKTIAKGDSARLSAVMPKLYPQIHFALNCGAKACPPIKTYSVEAVEEELDVAAIAFFEDDSNCTVDKDSAKVTLTAIIKWYSSDFGANRTDVLTTICQWLSGQKKADLEALLENPDQKIKLAFAPYDWSTDSGNSEKYRRQKSAFAIVAHLCSIL